MQWYSSFKVRIKIFWFDLISIYRHQEDIEDLLNNDYENHDYFECSHLLNGVLLPGLSSNVSDENESVWISEKESSPIQQVDEEYFIDNFNDAQKMEIGFF